MQGKLIKYIERCLKTTSMKISITNHSRRMQNNGTKVLKGLVTTKRKMEYWIYRMDH